jgi:catechol 2,3-dioxygenase-like lactoylglutathione lyase family enzyme
VLVVGSAYPGRHGSCARLLRRGPARQARRELDENAAESGYDGEAYTANDLRTLAVRPQALLPVAAARTQDPDDRFFQATSAARSYGTGMDIQFVASIAVITPDPQKSRELFIDALGLPLEATPGSDYFHSERVEGSKHFGVWPLSQAAQACFGTPDWPADRTVPQMSLEFEVRDADAVQSAAEELRQRGFTLLHDRREEPWGQTVARFQSEEGSIIGISFAPSLHDRPDHDPNA